MRQLKLLKIRKRALVVAIPKPNQPLGDPKCFRPISLLCVPFKILERLIYVRIKLINDPLLPKEHAWFRRERSTLDQVTLLTQKIVNSFSAKKKVDDEEGGLRCCMALPPHLRATPSSFGQAHGLIDYGTWS